MNKKKPEKKPVDIYKQMRKEANKERMMMKEKQKMLPRNS